MKMLFDKIDREIIIDYYKSNNQKYNIIVQRYETLKSLRAFEISIMKSPLFAFIIKFLNKL